MLVNFKKTKPIIKVFYFLAFIAALVLGGAYFNKKAATKPPLDGMLGSATTTINQPTSTNSPVTDISGIITTTTDKQAPNNSPAKENFSLPIADALARVTKKPFGIYISPSDSPISPEKFTGYHTGVDFETTPQEQEAEVPIYAICDGSLILKKTATGYGGVAVEACKFDGQPITVIYGHLKLSSVKPVAGDKLKAGEQLGVLGQGYSTETSGERKHLHLGIHQGAAINILGYVSRQSDLDNWFDFLTLIK